MSDSAFSIIAFSVTLVYMAMQLLVNHLSIYYIVFTCMVLYI